MTRFSLIRQVREGLVVDKQLPRALIAFAAVTLLVTAAFHATGYRAVAAAVSATTMSSFFQNTLPGVWLFFSWHLGALAIGLSWIALVASPQMKPLLWFISVVLFVDTLFVVSIAGVFPGTILLAVAVVSLLVASIVART